MRSRLRAGVLTMLGIFGAVLFWIVWLSLVCRAAQIGAVMGLC